MYKNVAFIPLRGGSKSIPLKNIKEINGRPLIYWTLDAATNSKQIEKVFVSTDSEKIKDVVNKYNSEKVVVIGRSEQSATDEARTEIAMLEFASQYEFQNIILIQATSPLLESYSIDDAFNLLEEKNYDSVISVTNQKKFIWEEGTDGAKPVNYNPFAGNRRQDFKGFYALNGAFYITTKEGLITNNSCISGKVGLAVMPENTAFEIDEIDDWIIIEEFLRRRNKK